MIDPPRVECQAPCDLSERDPLDLTGPESASRQRQRRPGEPTTCATPIPGTGNPDPQTRGCRLWTRPTVFASKPCRPHSLGTYRFNNLPLALTRLPNCSRSLPKFIT